MNSEIKTLFQLYKQDLPHNLHLEEEVVEHLLERVKYLENKLKLVSGISNLTNEQNLNFTGDLLKDENNFG